MMTPKDIAVLRLENQQISCARFKSPGEIVSNLGAIQAQDYPMSKWALGLRQPALTDQVVEAAISSGEIIRTHLMRPTWHFVAAEDVYWMLDLTAPQIKALQKPRLKELELNEGTIEKSKEIIQKVLAGKKALSRKELCVELAKGNISCEGQRAAHIMFSAELDGLICSGPTKAKQQTYALLKERVPQGKKLSMEEALAELARRYFTSHGPATINDFQWWSGLSLTKARAALEFVKAELVSESVENNTYWFAPGRSITREPNDSVHLIPAFDELIISYKDRTAALSSSNHRSVLSSNGIFRPAIVQRGQVKGIWSREIDKGNVVIKPVFFQRPDKRTLHLFEIAANRFGKFLGLPVKVIDMERLSRTN